MKILVVSLGNPAPYLDTLHSAGHMVLRSLVPLLRRGGQQQPWTVEALGGSRSCSVSTGRTFTLAMSPTMMNVSGPWVAKAYREAAQRAACPPLDPSSGGGGVVGLVVVHDDMEEALGTVKLRPWSSSHRGHNGLKSIRGCFSSPGADTRCSRISIGIGRPASRDPRAVHEHVLRKAAQKEKQAIQSAAYGVLEKLAELEQAWFPSA